MAEKKSWMDRLSETVDKAAKAAGEAWDGTADIRREAWEKTKAAGTTASAAIEEGVAKARRAYEREEGEESRPVPPAGDTASHDVVDEIDGQNGSSEPELPPTDE